MSETKNDASIINESTPYIFITSTVPHLDTISSIEDKSQNENQLSNITVLSDADYHLPTVNQVESDTNKHEIIQSDITVLSDADHHLPIVDQAESNTNKQEIIQSNITVLSDADYHLPTVKQAESNTNKHEIIQSDITVLSDADYHLPTIKQEESDINQNSDNSNSNLSNSNRSDSSVDILEINQQKPIESVPNYDRFDSSIPINSADDTIKEWKRRATKVAFIYDIVSDKYRKRLDLYTLLAFILSCLTTLFALGKLGLHECDYPNVTLALKSSFVVLATGAAICAGIVQIRGWDQLINSCQKYLNTVENFVALIISEQTLPIRIRVDYEQFIIQQKDKFQAILNSAPDIPHYDYLQALKAYEQSKARLRHDLINV
jgi:hypothetical protein